MKASSGSASCPDMSLEQRVGELRVDLERRLDQSRWAFDHRAIGALEHHVERECILRQCGEARIALNQREGIRAHDQERKRARIGRQRLGQDLDETRGLVPTFLVEQLLALIDSDERGERRRIVIGRPTRLRDFAQSGEKSGEPVVGLAR